MRFWLQKIINAYQKSAITLQKEEALGGVQEIATTEKTRGQIRLKETGDNHSLMKDRRIFKADKVT